MYAASNETFTIQCNIGTHNELLVVQFRIPRSRMGIESEGIVSSKLWYHLGLLNKALIEAINHVNDYNWILMQITIMIVLEKQFFQHLGSNEDRKSYLYPS